MENMTNNTLNVNAKWFNWKSFALQATYRTYRYLYLQVLGGMFRGILTSLPHGPVVTALCELKPLSQIPEGKGPKGTTYPHWYIWIMQN